MRRCLAGCVLFTALAVPAYGLGDAWPRLWLLAAGAGVLAAIATLASTVLVLQRLLREAGDGSGEAPETGGDLPTVAAAHERQLGKTAQRLTVELRQNTDALAGKLRQTLRHEARSLGAGLGEVLEPGAAVSPGHRLGHEIAALADAERQRFTGALEAAGQLGDWIEHLWPVLGSAAGRDVEAIVDNLPDPAASEWRSAARILRAFCHLDATALRRLGRLAAGAQAGRNGSRGSQGDTGVIDDGFLHTAGLLAGERPLPERLKRYLEPFDHLGRLGEVTLALQYLLEAYPVEQLSRDQRSRLRRELDAAIGDAGLEPDYHCLVTRIAAGAGLRYRPVRYYQSRTDQSDYAFVRQQVSPISLSQRVGFDATAERQVIVRLERPFFAQMSTGIYHAGHAHVARG